MKENHVKSAYGFTIGFDGLSKFAPIAVERFYNIDLASHTIVCDGEVAELALKRPHRVTISCNGCDYRIDSISRRNRDNKIEITVKKNYCTPEFGV